MLEQMRKNMPLILWILVIAFIATIIFSWGMGGFREKQKPGIIGIIYGREITYDSYEQMVQRQVSAKYQETGVEPVDQTVRDIRNQVWDSLVREALLEREAKRLGVTVTDQELVDLIRSNPPGFIQQNEYFQTEGNFDISKYHAFLQNPANAEQVIMLEQSYRQTLLERKLINRILNTVEVSDWEIRYRFEERNIMGKAKYLMFYADSMKVDSASITQTDIEDCYNQNKQEFLVPENRQILLVQFENETSHEDSLAVEELTAEIEERLEKGEDFGALAAEYSDHHTAADSGRLDWMPKKRLEADSDSAVWRTKVGQFTGPIINRYGAHFYLVEDRKMMEGELKSKLRILQLKYVPSPDTKDLISNKASNFAEEIKEADFYAVAEAYKHKVDTSGFFPKDPGFIPKLGKIKSVAEFAFAKPVGTTSDIYPLRNGWLVFKTIASQPEHFQSLPEVKDKIFEQLYKEARKDQSFAECGKFWASLSDKNKWADVAKKQGLTVGETENQFRFGDYVKNVGRDHNFTALLLRSQVGEIVGPLRGEYGSFIVQLTEKVPIDTVEFHRGKLENLPTLLQNKQEAAFNQWYEDLKKESNIKDFRYLFYRQL